MKRFAASPETFSDVMAAARLWRDQHPLDVVTVHLSEGSYPAPRDCERVVFVGAAPRRTTP